MTTIDPCSMNFWYFCSLVGSSISRSSEDDPVQESCFFSLILNGHLKNLSKIYISVSYSNRLYISGCRACGLDFTDYPVIFRGAIWSQGCIFPLNEERFRSPESSTSQVGRIRQLTLSNINSYASGRWRPGIRGKHEETRWSVHLECRKMAEPKIWTFLGLTIFWGKNGCSTVGNI